MPQCNRDDTAYKSTVAPGRRNYRTDQISESWEIANNTIVNATQLTNICLNTSSSLCIIYMPESLIDGVVLLLFSSQHLRGFADNFDR
jgi:hypothetical protein